MSVLITGGAGYIGSHTAKLLARDGYRPVTLDNLSVGHRHAVRWGPLIVGDVGDTHLVRETLRRYDVEAVIHFAAHAYVGESMEDPGRYFQNNVANTLYLLEAMNDAGVDTLVFSSTCATYGVPRQVPIPESHPQKPVNPYGESKLFVERSLHWFGQAHGLRWAALRYFNAAGTDPEGEIGEEHDPEPHLIPAAIGAALETREPLEIFGTDYPTPDGTAIRDYIHVTDLARAHIMALDYLRHGGESGAFNLGNGRGYSVREVVRAVEEVSGLPVPVDERPRRPGDPAELVGDATRARHVLGWQPQFETLESIVETAWRWQRQCASPCVKAGSS